MSQDFEKRTREVLEESTARLEGRTLSRLTQARHAALDRLQQPMRRRWGLFVPAGAAAAAVLAVVIWGNRTVPVDPGPVDDVEMLADGDAPDFVDGEDLEFYEWAAGEIES
jgi:negative regulator of sigma E activity